MGSVKKRMFQISGVAWRYSDEDERGEEDESGVGGDEDSKR